MKWRMISINSHVQRLWAGIRAAQLGQQWLRAVAPPGLCGGVRGRSATSSSHAFSLSWDLAMIRSVPLWGVILDASKCFDSLAVASVCAIAEKLGVDAVLLSAISRWYLGHERRVVVSQWIQMPIKPKRGLVQGCPLSVALCSIWGLVWVEKVSVILGSLPPQISYSNVYMDDMSFLASSRDKVELAMGFSGVYMAAWGIEINRSKSRLLVNASASSQEGPNVEGICVEVEHSLLGISAGSESTSSEIMRRLCSANRRLDRLDVLPLPQRSYQRLVSVFCSSLLYGIEVVPLFCRSG